VVKLQITEYPSADPSLPKHDGGALQVALTCGLLQRQHLIHFWRTPNLYAVSVNRDIYILHTGPLIDPLTFEEELSSHRLGFVSVQVNHGHLGACLPQGVGESATYALPSTRHVGHLSVEAHSIEDGAPLDPAENLGIRYFTL